MAGSGYPTFESSSATGPAPAEDFWSALAPDDAAALLARGNVRTFSRGQALLYEGQAPDRVLILRDGHVKVISTTATGREVVLAFRGPGELVGELSALDDEPRSASIVAVDHVRALTLTQQDFRSFLADRPAGALVLMRMLCRRLRDADAKRIEFAAYHTIGRVAVRLLELCDRFGRHEEGTIRISLPLSQEELAGWTGASIESVGRALQTMRSLGWIETGRREIRILDQAALRDAAR